MISGEYAARVKCLRTYDAVSKDVIHRWTYPLVPDHNFLTASSYKLYRDMVYKESDVKIDRSAIIAADSVIGEGTEIAEGAVIKASVIGRNCKIGARTVIEGSFLWDGAVVEEACRVERSILAKDSKVLGGSVIEEGSIISFGV